MEDERRAATDGAFDSGLDVEARSILGQERTLVRETLGALARWERTREAIAKRFEDESESARASRQDTLRQASERMERVRKAADRASTLL